MDVYTPDIRVTRVTHSVVATNWRPSWVAGVTAFGSPCNSKIQTARVKWQLDISQSKWHQGVFWSYSSGTPDKPSSVHHCSRIYSWYISQPLRAKLFFQATYESPTFFVPASEVWLMDRSRFCRETFLSPPPLVSNSGVFSVSGQKNQNCVPELSRDDWVARAR